MLAFPELIRDLPPKELLRVIPAVECGNFRAVEHRAMKIATAILLSEFWVFG